MPNGAILRNRVDISTTTPLTASHLSDEETTRIQVATGPLADLEVYKRVGSPTVVAGQLVTFTIVITNNGPAPVSSANLADLLPTGLTLVNVQSSQGVCSQGNCLLGALPFVADALGAPLVRGTVTVTIVARADADLAAGTVLTNTAYAQSERPDPTPENNLATAPVAVTQVADLSIVKSATPSVVTAGELVAYTLLVRNAGPSLAATVQVTDLLPAGVALVSADANCGQSAGIVLCTLGDLSAGELRTLALTVRVAPGAARSLYQYGPGRQRHTGSKPGQQHQQRAGDGSAVGRPAHHQGGRCWQLQRRPADHLHAAGRKPGAERGRKRDGAGSVARCGSLRRRPARAHRWLAHRAGLEPGGAAAQWRRHHHAGRAHPS